MLPKANRLTKKIQFSEVLSRGKTMQGKFFAIKHLKTNRDEPAKIGIIASKKIAKQAVYRNKARRRLREAVRSHVKSMQKGTVLAFLVKREILGANYSEVKQEVDTLIGRLHD